MTFTDGRGSTCAFHALERVGVDEGLRRARIEEGDTAELHGNGAAVDLDFGCERRVVDRYYTNNKTRTLLGEHDRSGRRTSQQGRGRRAPMTCLVESRGILTERWLLTCHLNTVAVA